MQYIIDKGFHIQIFKDKVSKSMNLKKLIFTVIVMFSMGTLSSAFAAGKIENATPAQVKESIASALKNSEDALAALKNGDSKETIMDLIGAARQDSKRIEVGRLDVQRNKASAKLKNARIAVNKGDNAAAEAALVDAVKGYEEIKAGF
jgi:hypothetical protein